MWKELSIYLNKSKWQLQGFYNLQQMLKAFGSITDNSPELCASLGNCGAIPLLFAGLGLIKAMHDRGLDLETINWITTLILTILHNTIRLCSSNLRFYRSSNAVLVLKQFLELSTIWQVISLLILAYVATDSEKKELASTKLGVRTLINILKIAVSSNGHSACASNMYYSAFEVLDAISQLAINDDVKNTIANEEAIPCITNMLQDDFSVEEQKVAADVLWNLAFIDSIRRSDALQSTIPALKKMTRSRNKEVRGASYSALFEIQGDTSGVGPRYASSRNSSHTPPPSYQEAISEPDPSGSKRSGQIMISYQWDSQERVIRIRDRLVAAGYRVWMDLTNMQGDIIDAMAEAVQTSDVVLMCMTERYKDSKNCRSEARYAYKLNKRVIPLLFQKDYSPDGWLGFLQGMDLYYAFDSDDQINTNMGKLLKVIAGDGVKAATGEEVDGPIRPSQHETQASRKPAAGNWSKQEVRRWLEDNDLTELCEKFKRFNGSHLEEMYSSLCNNKENFKAELKSDYELKGADCTMFVVALKNAFK
ncbi:uncharacterized protein [Amphiura filiformis]|uniref:uncharacterized protein n=1 Tax=Amphiura filiformis TaxID=82378 RepID=UPI003B218705